MNTISRSTHSNNSFNVQDENKKRKSTDSYFEKQTPKHSKKFKTHTQDVKSYPTEKIDFQKSEEIKKTAELFANTVISNLKEKFALIEKDEKLYWTNPEVPTGQNCESLKKFLMETLISNEKIKNELLVSVRLKYESLQDSEAKERNIVIFDSLGKVVGVMQKVHSIGEGTFGKVYNFFDPQKNYGLKLGKTRGETVFSDEEIEKIRNEMLNEMKMLQYLNKENKHLPGLQPAPKHLVIVLRGNTKGGELEAKKYGFFGTLYEGDASNHLDISNGWTSQRIFNAFLNLALALNYCHKNKLTVHGDIKPENIFENRDEYELVLGDFGGGQKIESEKNLTNNFSHTGEYVHAYDLSLLQESIDEKNVKEYKQIREKMDIFGLGASFYYILTGSLPYLIEGDNSFSTNAWQKSLPSHNKSNMFIGYVSGCPDDEENLVETIRNHLKERDPNLNQITKITQMAGQLIHQMVSENAEQRPTLKEVIKKIRSLLELF